LSKTGSKPFFLSSWILVPFGYLILIVISNLVSIESNSVLETQNRDDVSQPHILFIADPLISDLEIIDKLNLDTNLSLFTVNEESYKENATRAIDHVDSLEFNKYYIVGNGIFHRLRCEN
jgi:hypothetical protein